MTKKGNHLSAIAKKIFDLIFPNERNQRNPQELKEINDYLDEIMATQVNRTRDRDLNGILVDLSGDAAEALEALAEVQGITQRQALRKAIATEVYFLRKMKAGCKILLRQSDGEVREVIFR